MPKVQEPERKEKNGNRHFINEKVVKPAMTKKQIAVRTLYLAAAAVLFGIISCFSFTMTKPYAERCLGQEKEEKPISIPKDEPMEPSQEVLEAPTETESEPIEEQVQTVIENYRYTVNDVKSLLSALRSRIAEVAGGIVVVHSVQQEVDWFDNPVEKAGQYAGVVIAKTEKELLVLTPEAAVERADAIKVTFGENEEVSGKIKQKDSQTGLAIVSVELADLGEGMRQAVKVFSLGNSYAVREGDLLIAVGAPAGVAHSADYAIVSYVQRNAQMADQIGRLFYMDILSDPEKGTFFLNTEGDLVGWACVPKEESTGTQRTLAQVIGISDYKGILEKLSNGQGAPYFGVIGQEVSVPMISMGLPQGIYVNSAVTDGPAYNAGIQNGDIITSINGKPLTTMWEFQAAVEELSCGQTVPVEVQRNGREAFEQLEFSVVIQPR